METQAIYRQHQKHRWELTDIPWDQMRPNATADDLRLARGLAFGESNAIAALHLFLNESEDDYDFGSYAAIWCFEEIRHHYAFREWLERQGESLDDANLQAMRPAYPNGVTPAATIATNLISELTLTTVYSTLAEHVHDPALAEILRHASRDEARHARDFRLFLKRRVDVRRDEMRSVLETLYIYLSDPARPLKHPVDMFKTAVTHPSSRAMPDDAFQRFMEVDQDAHHLRKIRSRIMSSFATVTGYALPDLAAVRRAVADLLD